MIQAPLPGVISRLPATLRALRRISVPHKLGLLERLYGTRLARYGIAWVETAAGPLWKLDLADANQRWLVYGDYEGPRQMRWIRNWIRDGDVIVDSGANIGQMLVNFAAIARTRILAIEPLPHARDWLLECLALYPEWNVEVIASGLAAERDTVTLQIDGPRSTTQMDWYAARKLDTIEIEVTKLDAILRERQIDRVRLWKLDVEGAETAALAGARESLMQRRIDAVLVECNADRFEGLRLALDDVGYSIFEVAPLGGLRAISGLRHGNLVALPSEHSPVDR